MLVLLVGSKWSCLPDVALLMVLGNCILKCLTGMVSHGPYLPDDRELFNQ